VLFAFVYFVFRAVLRLAPTGRDQRDRDVEILVLRHQLKVLQRKAGRPMLQTNVVGSEPPHRSSRPLRKPSCVVALLTPVVGLGACE